MTSMSTTAMSPPDTEFFIMLSVVLPYSKSELDTTKQAKYKAAVASSAGTSTANVDIMSITESRRRAGSVQVETKIRAANEDDMTKISTSLGTGDALKTKIDRELKNQGLLQSTSAVLSTTGVSADSDSPSTMAFSSSTIAIIIGSVVGALLVLAVVTFCRCCRAGSKPGRINPNDQNQTNAGPVSVSSSTHARRASDRSAAPSAAAAIVGSTSNADLPDNGRIDIITEEGPTDVLEDVAYSQAEELNLEEMLPAVKVTSHDLSLPDAAHELKCAMFGNTFLEEASSALLDGILAAGQKVPAVGVIFAIMKDMKGHFDRFNESSEECRRLSVWCVSQMGTLGYLAKEATIDSNTDGLLRAAIPPLLELKKLTTSRREASTGYVGMTIAFWTSNEYLRKSGIAQNRVQSAIDALALRVQVNTQVDVQKVLKKCSMLPNMDKKLDTLVAMAEESNKKLDQARLFAM